MNKKVFMPLHKHYGIIQAKKKERRMKRHEKNKQKKMAHKHS